MSKKYSDIFISDSEPSLPGIKFYFNSSTNKLFYRDFEENSWEEISGTSLSIVSSLINTHNSDTTNVHGIVDTSSLVTNSSLSSSISGLSSIYLTQTDAALTYATQSSLSNYLTTSSASSTYATQSSVATSLSSYLTTSSAESIYATQSSLSNYLTTSSASSTYLTQNDASSTYLTQSNADLTYLTKTDAASSYDTAEQVMIIAISDETSNITTGTNKLTMRAPFAMTLTKIPRASLNTVSSSGNPTVDINVGGTSILGVNKLSIDANEKTSTTATTATTLETSSITDDAEITFDVDVAGSGAKGLKIALYYKKA